MAEKSFIGTLDEFSEKNYKIIPTYKFRDTKDGNGFECVITLLNDRVQGLGYSKYDAKCVAAAKMLKGIGIDHPDLKDFQELPLCDMINKLRDYCVQYNHPLPIFEIEQQNDKFDTIKFVCACKVATIVQYGKSEHAAGARQKAAFNMFNAIEFEDQMSVVPLDVQIKSNESERRCKFKTYRELVESSSIEDTGVLLCDRHKYFRSLYHELRHRAAIILRNRYDDHKTQALDIFDALNLEPIIEYTHAENSVERFVVITANCDYKFVLAGLESKIWYTVVKYFGDMLS